MLSRTSTPTRNGRGYLGLDGSHILEHFVNDVARDIPIRRRSQSCGSASARHRFDWQADEERKSAAARPTCASTRWATAPTTRRSYTTLGIASLNLGYGGEDDGGVYHSIYDDFYWYTHFADTDFVYGRARSRRWWEPR